MTPTRESPVQILIGGQLFKIRYMSYAELGQINGIITISQSDIKVRDDCTLAFKKYVLLHEIIHGITDAFVSSKMELSEEQTCLLSRSLFQNISDPVNEKVWLWIMGQDSE